MPPETGFFLLRDLSEPQVAEKIFWEILLQTKSNSIAHGKRTINISTNAKNLGFHTTHLILAQLSLGDP